MTAIINSKQQNIYCVVYLFITVLEYLNHIKSKSKNNVLLIHFHFSLYMS